MKNISLILLILSPLSLLADFHPAPAITNGSISVRGEATVWVEPDIIRVRFGIETRNMELTESQAENRAILKKALAAFNEMGLEDSCIKTDFLSVEPRYDNRNRKDEEFLGYYSQNGFVVTVKDKKTLEQVIDAALSSGVNYLHGVEFLTSELRKYRDQARDMAAQAALEKAQAMTSKLGATLGPTTNINMDNSYSRWGYHGSSGWNSRHASNSYMTQNAMSYAPSNPDNEDSEIQLGKISIQAAINVNFSYHTLGHP